MLSNLSGFGNKFSPVDQFLCPLFKKQRYLFFYPKTKFRTVLRYFELLFYYILLFFSQKNVMVLLVPLVPLVLRIPEAPRSADLQFNNTHRDLA